MKSKEPVSYSDVARIKSGRQAIAVISVIVTNYAGRIDVVRIISIVDGAQPPGSSRTQTML